MIHINEEGIMTKPQKVRPYLTTRSLLPENQETPIQFINNDSVENQLFFRRNHFTYPTLSYSNYWLPINGVVSAPLLLSMQDILQYPSKTVEVVLECSGDKRNLFEPKTFGEQWEKGAISQGKWKGVALRTLLEISGMGKGAKEVVVEGYDYDLRTDLDEVYTYTRSLPIEKALHQDTIIAYEYNNQPIPFKHGYPLRLIVPQWYAMASVKWIKQISVINTPFTGPFQTIDYMYYPNKDNDQNAFPVTAININSTIQKPLDMEKINTGVHLIKGLHGQEKELLPRWKLVLMMAIHGVTPIYYLVRMLVMDGLVGHSNGVYQKKVSTRLNPEQQIHLVKFNLIYLLE